MASPLSPHQFQLENDFQWISELKQLFVFLRPVLRYVPSGDRDTTATCPEDVAFPQALTAPGLEFMFLSSSASVFGICLWGLSLLYYRSFQKNSLL